MKKMILCGIAITSAAMMLTACAGEKDNDENSSIFEAQPGVVSSENGDAENGNAADGAAENGNAANGNVDSGNAANGNGNASSKNGNEKSLEDITGVSICDETTELDYDKDYDDEIRVAVERAVAESNSFSEEFSKMDEIQDHITSRRSQDQTQYEMNVASMYYYKVWDAELNNLWGRFAETVDEKTKGKYLNDQRNWISMKDEAILQALGPREEGGTIYPMSENTLLEESTKRRCYYLAKELAKVTGDSFEMPEKKPGGSYIDNQGTGSIYGSLSITAGWESGYVAKISMYRVGELEGNVEENGQGVLSFTSYDDAVKGTITYSWEGAKFEVTEVSGDSIVSVGDTFEFPFVF